ncbi:MAG: hypothetical protein HFH66_01375 [Lachnospiraceae bacterium]|nr:hypothetical protein [Lachnospiraceae bacterium]
MRKKQHRNKGKHGNFFLQLQNSYDKLSFVSKY